MDEQPRSLASPLRPLCCRTFPARCVVCPLPRMVWYGKGEEPARFSCTVRGASLKQKRRHLLGRNDLLTLRGSRLIGWEAKAQAAKRTDWEMKRNALRSWKALRRFPVYLHRKFFLLPCSAGRDTLNACIATSGRGTCEYAPSIRAL